MQFDLLSPVENQGVTISTDPQTEHPCALFKLFNVSERTITEVVLKAHLFDGNGAELGELDVTLSDLSAEPKTYFAENKGVSLEGFPETKHIVLDFTSVTFSDGEVYEKGEKVVDVSITAPDYDETVRLVYAAGEDAVCYAEEKEDHWLCVCGRPNLPQTETCVRCSRSKADVLEHFSTQDALLEAVSKQEEAERLAEVEQAMIEAAKKAERMAKLKKYGLIGAIVLAAVCLLVAIGFLSYRPVMTMLGNGAYNKEAYAKAYAYYVAADNEEGIAKTAELVKGNSNANLLQTGMMASDEENLYYIDLAYNIYKESKATGEKTRMGNSFGVYLNVVDGWVYYMDVTDGKTICRVNVEDNTIEKVYRDHQNFIGGLTVVGNELYFIVEQADTSLTPEQQQAIQEQGMPAYRYLLHKLIMGKDEPVKVSDTNIVQFVIYKDRIYYAGDEDAAIYSMKRDGSDVQKVVAGPVYNFDVYNDKIYYADSSLNEETQMPKLSLEVCGLDGSHIETAVSDNMAIVSAYEGDDIYYLQFNVEQGNGTLRKKTGEEDIVFVEDVQMFNLADGYVIYLDSEGNQMKHKADKSGFEAIVTEYPQMVPSENQGTTETE